ncbi:MAG: polymer-forming cytoskeletal protein [Flavobacteriaceae bacterium]|nr:polymer-forming cytoskeletal protein [Flavobacteriaceae bacterium]
MNNNKVSESPILIPKDSYVEGYVKSIKSIRLECAFHGTILTKNKVIIDEASEVTGDIICENLMLFGHVKGNVFCTGRVTMNEGSSVEGKIYTSSFTSLTETNSSFIVQIPKKSILEKVRGLLNDMTTEVGLSKDILLSTMRETFYEHVFARKTNPNDLISHEFTQQKKIVKPKVKAILSNGENSAQTEKKHQLVK